MPCVIVDAFEVWNNVELGDAVSTCSWCDRLISELVAGHNCDEMSQYHEKRD